MLKTTVGWTLNFRVKNQDKAKKELGALKSSWARRSVWAYASGIGKSRNNGPAMQRQSSMRLR
jgi:hypothetical protein